METRERQKSEEVVRLLDFRMYKTNSTVFYSLQLSNGRECWVVTRRYSEFLRCHVKLLELFNREQLPQFPPKEPFWQKLFGAQAFRDDWIEERYARLFGYIVGLLDMEGLRGSEALLEFLNAPPHRAEAVAEDETAVAVMRSVRVRLTGLPGLVEVVIRAEAPSSCAVRLALRPLEEMEEWGDESPPHPTLEGREWERLLELDLDPSKGQELCHRFELPPGSLWQVAAVGVSKDGSMGNVVCIQIRAPGDETLAQVRKSLEVPQVEQESTQAETSGRSASEAAGYEVKWPLSEEEEVDEQGEARRRRGLASGSSKVISWKGSVAVEYARRLEEKQRQEAERAPHRWEAKDGLRRSVPVDRLEAKSASGAAQRHHYGTVEVLDNSIQAQQELQQREDERRAAQWIHSVTGDAQAGAAAAGKGSLQEALHTGEVLCDLINAIWPGRIVGISRGASAQILFRQVANITHFVQFCSSLGMSHSVFAPADLAEGRNFRGVVRCIYALAQHVPESWEGPRLHEGRPVSPPKKSEKAQNGQNGYGH